ncbi:MAG: NAD(+)/NADH kinase [Roseburia sp.]|nr:NAD(+)/NADH kinase [Roseburia sp.]
MKHFLIYTNENKDKELEITERIRRFLTDRGQRVTLCVRAANWKQKSSEEAPEFPEDIDCMLVLGGDGTVLGAAGETRELNIPLIGVNLGTLGYMSQIEPAGLEEALERLIEGDYEKESRMMLNGKVFLRDGTVQEGWALNDIVIARSGSLQIIHYNIYVNGQILTDYQADGIIITTPTGSTGYNLSAGGPLVEPSASLIVLTPICAHTLNQRSIVLSAEDVIEIEIVRGREGHVQHLEANFDGSPLTSLTTGDRIRIVRSGQSKEFIRLSRASFLETLRRKLSE